MKRFLLALSLITLIAGNVYATSTIGYPNAITNGITADGDKIQENMDEAKNKVNTHNAATTGEHGVSGTIVGTTDTQTLTNKTLGASTISGDMTFGTGIKAIFGNSARYIKDNSSLYSIEFSSNVIIQAGVKLWLDGGGNTYITRDAANNIDFYVGTVLTMQMADDMIISDPTYDNTSAQAANMYIDTNGIMYRSTSARKYKTNEKPLSFDKNKLMGLKAITYNSKCKNDDKTKEFIGIVADDAIRFYPELVVLGKEGEPEGFQYERLTVVLLNAVQSQQEQIDSLTKRIEKLEQKVGN